MMKQITCFLLITCLFFTGYAQDTLPGFSVVDKGNNKIIVSWTNTSRNVAQISVQRSTDSIRGFTTVMTVPDPNIPQNGFADNKLPNTPVFYRLFIVMDKTGNYTITPSKRPVLDTSKATAINNNKAPFGSGTLIIKRRDSVVMLLPEKDFKKFRDSMMFKTKDTLSSRHGDTFYIRPFSNRSPREVIVQSKYVRSDKEGNVIVQVPVSDHHYSIKFFEENNNLLFEIKHVKGPALIIDKVNFIHAGNFFFELFEDGKLKERNKFYIPRDF